MFTSNQDTFISCGYDCNINVFDMRKRSIVQQYKQPYSLSTICISACGTFCVAGNLKGDITSFDFRHMKEPLDMKRAHDTTVVRVAFIPSEATEISFATNDSMLDNTNRKSIGVKDDMMSFAKFIDVCHYNNIAEQCDFETTERKQDSWAEFMNAKKISDQSPFAMFDTSARLSVGLENISELRLKRNSVSSPRNAVNDNNPKINEMGTPMSSGINDIVIQDNPKSENFKEPMRIEKQNSVPSNWNNEQSTLEVETQHPVKNNLNEEVKKTVSFEPKNRRSTFSESFETHIKKSNISTPLVQPIRRSSLLNGIDNNLPGITEEEIEASTTSNDETKTRAKFHDSKKLVNTLKSTSVKERTDPNGEIITLTVGEFTQIINEIFEDMKAVTDLAKSERERELYEYFKKKIDELEQNIHNQCEKKSQMDLNQKFQIYFAMKQRIENTKRAMESMLQTSGAEWEAKLPELKRIWKEQYTKKLFNNYNNNNNMN